MTGDEECLCAITGTTRPFGKKIEGFPNGSGRLRSLPAALPAGGEPKAARRRRLEAEPATVYLKHAAQQYSGTAR